MPVDQWVQMNTTFQLLLLFFHNFNILLPYTAPCEFSLTIALLFIIFWKRFWSPLCLWQLYYLKSCSLIKKRPFRRDSLIRVDILIHRAKYLAKNLLAQCSVGCSFVLMKNIRFCGVFSEFNKEFYIDALLSLDTWTYFYRSIDTRSSLN